MKTGLIVVDMQNGFVNDNAIHILPNVRSLIERARSHDIPIAFTRFVNSPGSGYVKWIGWSRLMGQPETDIIPELQELVENVFDKPAYSAFTRDLDYFLGKHEIRKLVICGVATDGCVLKTAVDAFERDIEPIVVGDACASHAGEDVHRAGLLLLGRFIGKGQIVDTDAALEQLSAS